MKRAKGIGWLCILPLIVLLAILPAAQCLESGTSEINFPADKSLGTVNIEVNQDHPPYFASIKPPLGKAQGKLKYPTGSKLQVIAGYAVVENPAMLASLNHKDIVALQFTSLPVDAAFVGRLKGFKYLRKLRLDETDLDDTVFKELAAISDLEDINLAKTMVKGEGLKNLAALKRLNTLNLNHDQLNPNFCRQLSTLAALRCLDLANCGIDDSCLQVIAGMTGLVELRLNTNPGVTDRGLAFIKDMRGMRDLDISDTRITLKGVTGLRLPDLKVLSVRHLIFGKVERNAVKKNSPHVYLKSSAAGNRQDSMPLEIFGPLH